MHNSRAVRESGLPRGKKRHGKPVDPATPTCFRTADGVPGLKLNDDAAAVMETAHTVELQARHSTLSHAGALDAEAAFELLTV